MNQTNTRAAALTAALFFLGAGFFAAEAGAAARVAANPVLVTLPAKSLATSLTLQNKGEEPVTMQAEVLEWKQQDGADAVVPTRELLVSPPIFKIAPGATQTVRVGRLKAGVAGPTERPYRLEITEVPPAESVAPGKITTVLKLSLPVFVPAAERAAPTLAWQARRAGDGLVLAASNSGSSHAKIVHLALLQDGKPLAEQDVNYYVLPGSTRQWTWPQVLKGSKGALQLKATLEGHKTVEYGLDAGALAPAPEAKPAKAPKR